MPARHQPSRRRSGAPWRPLLIALLLAPAALAQTSEAPPQPARATTQAEPGATPDASGATTAPEARPTETNTPEAWGPMLQAPQAPAVQPVPPPDEAGASPPRTVRPTAPSRAPGAARESAPASRRRPAPTPEASRGERRTPPPRPETDASGEDWSPAEDDFGRWEQNTQECEIELQEPPNQAPERMPCRSLRLDQQLAGLLSIRFLPTTRGQGAPPQQLLFAGVLQPGSQPMRCRDNRCEPRWPIRVQLSALATSNVRTLGLPQARVIQGRCSLEANRVLCQARDREGRRWQARGRW